MQVTKDNLGTDSQENRVELSRKEALRRVELAMSEVVNGEIIVKMQGGKPIWVDKFERERVG